MQIERRYRKLDWWGLIDHINSALENEDTEQGVYIELLDELRMRTLESVSEGSTYKINTQANKLIENFNCVCSMYLYVEFRKTPNARIILPRTTLIQRIIYVQY